MVVFDLDRFRSGTAAIHDGRHLAGMTEAAARTFAFILAGTCIELMF
jgi:hypothetical protein